MMPGPPPPMGPPPAMEDPYSEFGPPRPGPNFQL